MIIARTVVVTDPLARANVVQTLGGAGAPAGVTACVERGDAVDLTFDDERAPAELIDALVEIALRFVPGRAAPFTDGAAATAAAARGLQEPALDRSRVIEAYLP